MLSSVDKAVHAVTKGDLGIAIAKCKLRTIDAVGDVYCLMHVLPRTVADDVDAIRMPEEIPIRLIREYMYPITNITEAMFLHPWRSLLNHRRCATTEVAWRQYCC